MKKAKRLLHVLKPSVLKSSPNLASLVKAWVIEGEPGIYIYVNGCPADAVPDTGQLVASLGSCSAIFARDVIFDEQVAKLQKNI